LLILQLHVLQVIQLKQIILLASMFVCMVA